MRTCWQPNDGLLRRTAVDCLPADAGSIAHVADAASVSFGKLFSAARPTTMRKPDSGEARNFDIFIRNVANRKRDGLYGLSRECILWFLINRDQPRLTLIRLGPSADKRCRPTHRCISLFVERLAEVVGFLSLCLRLRLSVKRIMPNNLCIGAHQCEHLRIVGVPKNLKRHITRESPPVPALRFAGFADPLPG